LHSNGQLRTERDGDTEKGCHKPADELQVRLVRKKDLTKNLYGFFIGQMPFLSPDNSIKAPKEERH